MINNIIASTFLLVYGYYFFKDVKKSMVLLYVFGMVSPNFLVGNVAIPLYIVIFIEMIFLFVLFRSQWLLSIKLDKKDVILFCILIYLNCVTFINIILGNIYDINFLSIFSDWRFWFWYVLIRKLNFDSYDDFITPVLLINFIIVVYQFFYPTSVDIFYQLYNKASYGVINGYMQQGYFSRPVGTLLSPVVLGAFSILCVAFYLTEIKVKYRKIKIMLSVFLGVFALSKTAIIGIPIIVFIHLIKNRFSLLTIFKFVSISALVILIIYLILSFDNNQINQINYYSQFLLDPFKSLDSRYSEQGNVYSFYVLLKDYLWFGIGSNEFQGIKIIDSMYISLIAQGGLIFLVTYILWLADVSRSYLIFFALLLTGFGGSYIFYLMILPFVCNEVYRQGKSKSNNL